MPETWKRNVVLFLASQNISHFGSMLVQHAINWHITLTTQSGSMMTIAIVCSFLPMLLVSPFAGVWADRYNRRLLIVAADSLIALCTLALAVLFIMDYESIWLLFLASAFRSLGTGIQMPAVGAFLPQITPVDQLTRVNGANSAIQSAVAIFSPMLGGALLTVASIEAVFFVDVVTAALAIAILTIWLRVGSHVKAGEAQPAGYFADVLEGIRFIRRHPFLKTFFLFNAAFFIFLGPVAFLTPLQVARNFGDQVWRLTALEVVFSVGMTLGGILIASWGGFRNKMHSMATANLVFGVCTVLLGVTPIFWVYLAFMGTIGIAVPIFNTPAIVMLQQKVENAFLGRVFGVNTMIASALMPLTMLFYGPLADIIPIEWMLWATGSLLVVQSLLMMTNRALLEAGKPLPQEARQQALEAGSASQ